MLALDIGRAVQAARTRIRMSVEDLAKSTSLDTELLGAIESGQKLVSTAKLDRIATALGLDAFALYRGREVERGLVVLPRHAGGNDFHQEDLPVLRRAFDRAAALFEVSSLVGKQSLAGQFDPMAPGADPALEGYHCARRVRASLGCPKDPLDDLPTLLAERFQVPVVEAALATRRLWAATVRSSASRVAAIVLNPTVEDGPTPGSAQAWLVDRVSICHELCHVLFDASEGDIVDVVLDDLPRDGQKRSLVEQRAGAFAAEMLIPLHGLRGLLGQEGRQTDTLAAAERMVDEVRAHFNTPAEIAVNHLYNHGYVAKIADFRETLIRGARQREAQTPLVPVGQSDAWRRVLLARTQEAYEGCLVTDGTARALLELPPGEPLPWERDAK